jgi:peptidoglycan/xylan/chitin deacetylase (PgdA/CDA1 family)
VVEPPSHYALRRAQRRRQLRRRRLAGVGGLLAILVAIVLLLLSTGGGGSAKSGPSVTVSAIASATRGAAHRTHAVHQRGAAGKVDAIGNEAAQRLAKLGLPVYCGGHHGDEVAFTFDDGPGPYTSLALKKLRESHERATFFIVGRSADQFPGYLPQELKLAAIGDHTYTHPELTALPAGQVYSEIFRTARKIEAESGEHVDLFRPPYELHNATVDQIAKQLGLLEILWNVDSADSLGADYAQITRNVEAGLRAGSIILMHENRGQTIRALTTLLPELRRRHLRSVSIPELLASDPPSAAQLRAGPAGCGLAGAARSGSGA